MRDELTERREGISRATARGMRVIGWEDGRAVVVPRAYSEELAVREDMQLIDIGGEAGEYLSLSVYRMQKKLT